MTHNTYPIIHAINISIIHISHIYFILKLVEYLKILIIMKIIYLIAFLSGLFLTLSAYILYGHIFNIPYAKEDFQVQTQNQSKQNTVEEEKVDIHIPLKLPKTEHNYMILTTFNNANKIKNQELRWYDDKIQMDNILMTDFNKGAYFSLGNAVTYETDKLVRFVQGANLHNIQLTGPIAMYFSNSDISPYELSQFSLLFMMKLHSIQGSNVLFEMLCNTSVVDTYIANVICMKLIELNEKYFQIEIIFGTERFVIPNLEKHLLVNDSINLLALTFGANSIVVRINSTPYIYTYTQNTISLGSSPVIVNKNGSLEMVLYSMAYYKKALTVSDMTEYIRYNMFYFNGINILLDEKQKYLNIQSESDSTKTKIDSMSKLLDKCTVSNDYIDTNQIPARNNQVPKINTPYPSKMPIDLPI